MFKTLDELTRFGKTTSHVLLRSMLRWAVGTLTTALWIPAFIYMLPAD